MISGPVCSNRERKTISGRCKLEGPWLRKVSISSDWIETGIFEDLDLVDVEQADRTMHRKKMTATFGVAVMQSFQLELTALCLAKLPLLEGFILFGFGWTGHMKVEVLRIH